MEHTIDRRRRILDAIVLVVHDHGFAGATVTRICAQAKVGRATFYGLFQSPQECFMAVMHDGYLRVHELIAAAFEREHDWTDGVRAALAALLAFFDAEPRLARVWVVETLGAGTWALEQRDRYLTRLTRMIVSYWPTPDGAEVDPLMARAMMEAVVGAVRAHMLDARAEPLVSLLGPLTALVATPYLPAERIAGEAARGERASRELLRRAAQERPATAAAVELPALLRDARAHRARRCVTYLAARPDASNRGIARAVGIHSDTHISSLLARLNESGLVEKVASKPGGPNAWRLSAHGARVARILREGARNTWAEEHGTRALDVAGEETLAARVGAERKDGGLHPAERAVAGV